MNKCLHCKKDTANIKFCTHKCQFDWQYSDYISKWKSGKVSGSIYDVAISRHIRKYLFEKYSNSCSQCSWSKFNPFTEKIPLEINHKDGNWKNSIEDNLELLCPNCHALTSNYGSLNKGQGRRTFIENKNRSKSNGLICRTLGSQLRSPRE